MGTVAVRMLLPVLAFFLSSFALGEDSNFTECEQIFSQEPLLSSDFSDNVAHAIHSLTIEDIEYYFRTKVSEKNQIPVIDKNLISSTPILDDAPKRDMDTSFKTVGLQVAEEALTHMGDSHWDIGNSGVLGKLVHSLHMHELWYEAGLSYQKILENPPKDPQFCACLKDVENNGIYYHLRRIAMMIREPELSYNENNRRIPRQGRARYEGSYNNGNSYNNGRTKEQLKLAAFRKKREAEEKLEVTTTKPPLDTKAYWMETLEGFRSMTDIHPDMAVYMYCMLA